jgi:thiol-disulfide isomerase/thioredoxin
MEEIMKKIDYKTACELDLNRTINDDNFVIVFGKEGCPACLEFMEIAIPTIEEYNFTIYTVDATKDSIPFAPQVIPTSYWYFQNREEVYVKNGMPPVKEYLTEFIEQGLEVNYG